MGSPGAVSAFQLWGEVMLTGVMVTVASLLVITLPAALAAGARHLRLYINGDGSPWAEFWGDVRRALPGGLVVGLGWAVLSGVLAFNIMLARTGALPGGIGVEAFSWLILVVAAVAVAMAAQQWQPDGGWRATFPKALAATREDSAGTLYIAIAVGLTGFLTWTLAPLILPALGCLVLALVATPMRARRKAAG